METVNGRQEAHVSLALALMCRVVATLQLHVQRVHKGTVQAGAMETVNGRQEAHVSTLAALMILMLARSLPIA
jgi:hypothetical protein